MADKDEKPREDKIKEQRRRIQMGLEDGTIEGADIPPSLDGDVQEPGECVVCGTPLVEAGGAGGTGMCGPCCTGESDTVGEF